MNEETQILPFTLSVIISKSKCVCSYVDKFIDSACFVSTYTMYIILTNWRWRVFSSSGNCYTCGQSLDAISSLSAWERRNQTLPTVQYTERRQNIFLKGSDWPLLCFIPDNNTKSVGSSRQIFSASISIRVVFTEETVLSCKLKCSYTFSEWFVTLWPRFTYSVFAWKVTGGINRWPQAPVASSILRPLVQIRKNIKWHSRWRWIVPVSHHRCCWEQLFCALTLFILYFFIYVYKFSFSETKRCCYLLRNAVVSALKLDLFLIHKLFVLMKVTFFDYLWTFFSWYLFEMKINALQRECRSA